MRTSDTLTDNKQQLVCRTANGQVFDCKATSQNCKERLWASSCLPFRLSFRPYGTTRLLLNGSSCNFILAYFSEICREKINSLKSDNHDGHFTGMSSCDINNKYSAEFLLEREMLQTTFIDKITTHFMFSKFTPPQHPPPENRTVHQIMRENVVQPDMRQVTM